MAKLNPALKIPFQIVQSEFGQNQQKHMISIIPLTGQIEPIIDILIKVVLTDFDRFGQNQQNNIYHSRFLEISES